MSGTETSTTDEVVETAADIVRHPDAEFNSYWEAVKMVTEPLTARPNTWKINSVLHSLLFYTREEHLDEYFCTTCNEGLRSVLVRNIIAHS